MTDLPTYVWIAHLVALVGFGATLYAVLNLGARAAGASRRGATVLAAVAGGVLAAWVAATSSLAAAGVYRQDADEPIVWLGVALASVLVGSLLAAQVPAVARALADRATPARLAAPQTWRIFGVVFLILMVTGDLPAEFAVPAGLGDIAIGISAPFIARRLAAGDRRGAIAFNVLGIVDLVTAVTLGVLAAPGPLQLLQVTPSTEAMTLLPLALIPTVVVPICIALHILSLRRLSASYLARQENPQLASV